MATVTDYLIKLQDLTQQNLDILKAINESFLTNKAHLSTTISGVTYSMPSFLALENKINLLREDFDNLVNAPKTGEAYFTFDGNSRAIEVRGYTHTPSSLILPTRDEFGVKTNNIFKDFLNPTLYLHFDLSSIPNDITTVNVKKVIPIAQALKERFALETGENATVQYMWGDLYKILSLYSKDVDYIEYDTTMNLPIRKNIGSGTYVIEKVVDDVIDENLDEYVTIKFRTDVEDATKNLSYKTFDETIDRYLNIGDQLVTYDDSAKMEITEIQNNTNTVTVKILFGDYLNLVESNVEDTKLDDIEDLCKLKFFSPVDFDNDKYVQVPLEEDQYVFIAIAPLNNRMNVQSPWGSGLLVNTYKLTNSDGVDFKTYYNNNINNIGDVLNDITSMMSESLTKYNKDEFDDMVNYKPTINTNNLSVIQINSHLNDSDTIKNIRALYSQKKQIKLQLNEVQTQITDINSKLNQISFEDTSNLRSVYTTQLSEYNQTKNDLNTSLNKILDQIAINANNSDIPIENAKYHIRGFFDCTNDIDGNEYKYPIRGIQVQYRYKNVHNTTGKAMTINEKYIFSDWNVMSGFNNVKVASNDGSGYKFNFKPLNDDKNEPSFNQIDIPISQGETVDLRLKIIYDYGFPFVEVASGWSDIVNISFPSEYLKDVQILDILKENNDDIETYRFENIISEKGITKHIDDEIIDQDITYFHNPSHIASGFYTNERRIIPLKDKLEELSNQIILLRDEINESSSSSLDVYAVVGDSRQLILPFQSNYVYPKSYKNVVENYPVSGYKKNDKGYVETYLNIILSNTSSHVVKLYPIFPGPNDETINSLKNIKYDKGGYCGVKTDGVTVEEKQGVYMGYPTGAQTTPTLQLANQYITFRINNPYDGTKYYKDGANGNTENQQSISGLPTLNGEGAVVYPKLNEKTSLCLDNSNKMVYKVINPGESIIVPIYMEYCLKDTASINKTLSFDLRTSLYKDLNNYTFTVVFKQESTLEDEQYVNNPNIGESYKIAIE